MPEAGVKPTARSFAAAIGACERSGQLGYSAAVLKQMQAEGFGSDEPVEAAREVGGELLGPGDGARWEWDRR